MMASLPLALVLSVGFFLNSERECGFFLVGAVLKVSLKLLAIGRKL